MKTLVYGICLESNCSLKEIPEGVRGARVEWLRACPLAAVCSLVPSPGPNPEVADLLAFARVVEALSRPGPVLPMRYGCFLDETSQVVEILQKRQAVFQSTLEDLRGMEEWSVHFLAANIENPTPDTFSPLAVNHSHHENTLAAGASGKSYLEQRQGIYGRKAQSHLRFEETASTLRQAFLGLYYRDCLEGRPISPGRNPCVHFLVSREQQKNFRAAFRLYQDQSQSKLMLTGPWPPYHFAGENPEIA